MSIGVSDPPRTRVRAQVIGIGAAGMGLASIIGVLASLWKVLAIGWVGFGAMMGGAVLGEQSPTDRDRAPATRLRRLTWAYGLSSGAMVTSAALFLVPTATAHHAQLGGIGIALGLLIGFALHTLPHSPGGAAQKNTSQKDMSGRHAPGDRPSSGRPSSVMGLSPVVVELTLHAGAAGLVIGSIYAAMPSMGATLGVSIISHKAPAGYAAARRIRHRGHPISSLLLPAAAVAVTAVPIGLITPPRMDALYGLAFGVATGVFLHVALDFLPQCEWGSELYRTAGFAESPTNESGCESGCPRAVRREAVLSTGVGGLLVVGAWALL
jgi:hypothetical protein